MKDNKLNFKLVNILLVIAIICLLYFIRGLWIGIVVNLFNIISPFLLAFAIAYVIYPLVNKLITNGAPKWLAILAVCILIIGALLIILFLTIPLLYEQSLLFISNLTVLLSNLSTKYEINFGNLPAMLSEFSGNIISGLGSSISNGAIGVFNSSINLFSSAVVVMGASIYFLIDMSKIRKFVKDFFYDKNKRTLEFLKSLDKELTKYVGGMVKNILVQGLEYTLAFAIIGHPNFLILGILSGISAIIPWFGGFIVSVLSLLVSFVIGPKMFILTAIISIICPILDGNVIGPKIYGKSNKLHPLVVIFAVSAGGVIGGFWGILVSLPIIIAIKAFYNFYEIDINKKLKKALNKVN